MTDAIVRSSASISQEADILLLKGNTTMSYLNPRDTQFPSTVYLIALDGNIEMVPTGNLPFMTLLQLSVVRLIYIPSQGKWLV